MPITEDSLVGVAAKALEAKESFRIYGINISISATFQFSCQNLFYIDAINDHAGLKSSTRSNLRHKNPTRVPSKIITRQAFT